MRDDIQLTPELEHQILAGIRSGGFPHVAATAFGVPPKLFRKWMRLGLKEKDEVYAAFALRIGQARATARLNAEVETHGKDPRLWLRAGPGRETATSEGWTTFVPPREQRRRSTELLKSPERLQFLGKLRKVLSPFPDALEAVAKQLSTSD